MNKWIYLASQSPRRAQLLTSIGINFDILKPPLQSTQHADMVDESVLDNESAKHYVLRLAQEKARYAARYVQRAGLEPRIICSADTTVTIDGEILGKPENPEQAAKMMRLLSNNTHQVMTGVAVINTQLILHSIVQTSEVTFCELSEQLIARYISTKEPYDKAGGYGIQGYASRFISNINGSYSGIMGLPIYETVQLLTQAGMIFP